MTDLTHRPGETLADVFDRCRIPKDVRRELLDELDLPDECFWRAAKEFGLTIDDLVDDDPEQIPQGDKRP